jgi:hypothetical protein
MAWGDIEWWNGIEHIELKNSMWKQTGRARVEAWMSDQDKQNILKNYDVVGQENTDDRAPADLDEGMQPMKKKLRVETDAPMEVDPAQVPLPTTPPSVPNNRPTTQDPKDVVMQETNTVTERAQQGDPMGSNNGTQETQIQMTNYVQRNIFPEIVTAKLPLVFYMSVNGVHKNLPVVLTLGLNSPYEILTDNTLVAQTINTLKSRGLSNCNSYPLNNNNFGTFVPENNFPVVVPGQTSKTSTTTSSGAILDASCVPARRTHYEKVYENYTTLGCDYSVDIDFISNGGESSGVVFWQRDTTTQNSSNTDICPKDVNLNYMRSFPQIKSRTFLPSNHSGIGDFNHKESIKGSWAPNQSHKDTRNSEDIKTWCPVKAPPPNLHREKDVFFFYGDWQSDKYTKQCFNLRIFMEWTVQFRDLKNYLRYPRVGVTVLNGDENCVRYPEDFLQTPRTTESVP